MDPIEFEAGDVNFYRYVGNDCVNFVDPSGLLIWLAWGAAALVTSYVGYQFYDFGDALVKASAKGKKAGELKSECHDAILNNDPKINEKCDPVQDAMKKSIKDAHDLTVKGACLPGVLCGGPIPTNIPDVISSEIVNQIKDRNATK